MLFHMELLPAKLLILGIIEIVTIKKHRIKKDSSNEKIEKKERYILKI